MVYQETYYDIWSSEATRGIECLITFQDEEYC